MYLLIQDYPPVPAWATRITGVTGAALLLVIVLL
jgi:hypothetical protein